MGESILFQINGLIVVFIALGAIWAMLELMGLFFRRSKPATTPPAPAVSSKSAATVSATGGEGLSPEIIAVVSAAVHVATAGQPHRIAAIVPANAELDWAREGRRTIFASHKTR